MMPQGNADFKVTVQSTDSALEEIGAEVVAYLWSDEISGCADIDVGFKEQARTHKVRLHSPTILKEGIGG